MKYLSGFTMASALLLSAASCGGGGLEGAAETWTKASCACKDKECATKQKEAFNKIEHDFKKDIKAASKDTMKRLDGLLDKANKCLSKYEVRAG